MSAARDTEMPWAMAVLFTAVGLASLALAAWFAREQVLLRQHSERAPGRVVELVRSCDGDGCTYRPVVEFSALDEPVRITGSVGSSPPAFSVGEAVQVLYRVEAPQEGQIDSWLESWFGTAFGLVFGAAFGGVGAATIAGRLRRRPAAPGRPGTN